MIWMLLTACQVQKTALQPADAKFPQHWIGTWIGDLKIYSPRGMQQSVLMTLEIKMIEPERFSYNIKYNLSAEDLRSYELLRLDSIAGQFLIDEKNGIRMEAALLGGRLMSQFDVMGNRLLSTAYRQNDFLYYDIYMMKDKQSSITGDTILNNTDTIPTVITYPVRVFQTAQLTRKE